MMAPIRMIRPLDTPDSEVRDMLDDYEARWERERRETARAWRWTVAGFLAGIWLLVWLVARLWL